MKTFVKKYVEENLSVLQILAGSPHPGRANEELKILIIKVILYGFCNLFLYFTTLQKMSASKQQFVSMNKEKAKTTKVLFRRFT